MAYEPVAGELVASEPVAGEHVASEPVAGELEGNGEPVASSGSSISPQSATLSRTLRRYMAAWLECSGTSTWPCTLKQHMPVMSVLMWWDGNVMQTVPTSVQRLHTISSILLTHERTHAHNRQYTFVVLSAIHRNVWAFDCQVLGHKQPWPNFAPVPTRHGQSQHICSWFS